VVSLGRDVGERRVVVERAAGRGLRPELGREAAPELGLRLELDPPEERAAAVAEEVVRPVAVALDEVPDLVAVEVEGGADAARPPQRDVVLHAALGLEVGVAGHEAPAAHPPVVAVGERRVAETAARLDGERGREERPRHERQSTRRRPVGRLAVPEVPALVAGPHVIPPDPGREHEAREEPPFDEGEGPQCPA
jgi:hypothetical protein